MDVALPSHVLIMLGPVPITNSVLSAFVITLTLGAFSFFVSRRFAAVPTRFQVVAEALFDYLLTQIENAFGSKERARKFFPLLMTLMIFIAVANQFSLVPLVASFTYGGKPLLRTTTSDLSQTATLALVIVILSHVIALSISPLRHIGNFIKVAPFFKVRSLGDLGNALLGFALGLLDIVGEIAKVLSLSCRLFGNIFAGEIMVVVIASLAFWTQFLLPIPFMFLSLFSGFVQAFVFTLLSMQFLAGTVRGHLDTLDERQASRSKLAAQTMEA